jgi:recombinational DNA repair protein (RecF pathway)
MAALDDRRVMLVGGSAGFCSMSDTYVLDTKVVSRFDVDALRALGLARGPDADHCVVCLDEAPSQMFAFCGHTVLCQRCSRRSLETCPICRAVVAKTVGLNMQD